MSTGSIRIQPWARYGERDIFLLSLHNSSSKITFSNYGALVQAWVFTGAEIDFDVVLGFDTFEAYEQDSTYMGAVVGRYAGRIAGGRFMLDGRQVNLEYVSKASTLHGGRQGFNKKVWDIVYPQGYSDIQLPDDAFGRKSPDCPFVIFHYESTWGEEGFPGSVSVFVRYSLSETNEWQIDYHASSTLPTPINLTQHVYFNLSGKPDSGINQHLFKIFSKKIAKIDSNGLPDGTFLETEESPFDFSRLKTLAFHDRPFAYDHSFLLQPPNESIVPAATVFCPDSNILLEAFTGEPSIHLYTGDFLTGNDGKNGSKISTRAGFCLESQHLPDSPNQPSFPNTLLRPGEIFSSSSVYKLSLLPEA